MGVDIARATLAGRGITPIRDVVDDPEVEDGVMTGVLGSKCGPEIMALPCATRT